MILQGSLREGKRGSLDSREKAVEIARLILDKKGERVVILDIKDLSTVADYLVICSGGSERHIQAMATWIGEELEKTGESPLGVEGLPEGRWVLMDYNDVVVHLFLEEVRTFYNLEGLWAEAPRIHVDEKTLTTHKG